MTPGLPAARRILIYGVTGSGKSTFARQLGAVTKLPCHLVDDEIGWLPGWKSRPMADQQALASAIAAGDEWILDSAYAQWRSAVMPRVELLIALDYPRWLSFARLTRRSLRRVYRCEEVCNGNRETLGRLRSADSILLWHFSSFARKRRTMRALAANPGKMHVVIFRHPRQAERWLDQLAKLVVE
ncbi:adenylate kinase [Paenarthrobacter sp. Z7-10]|uniref:adenylate kinase n=1 Tax=Paenarthrobacter sp. Z7-10 TaxID=2787635 RepID=UPI0022A9EC2B|nr:adenylate kinase [Paenarthrobacter sp. Z7-10]MCZ2402172.1 adenylate kinase [Paenarthrobacter sp. Z7-10]